MTPYWADGGGAQQRREIRLAILSIACPRCSAVPGAACVYVSRSGVGRFATGQPTIYPHKERRAVWEAVT